MDGMKYFQIVITAAILGFFMLHANSLSDAVLPVVVGLVVQSVNLINDKRTGPTITKPKSNVTVSEDAVIVEDKEGKIEIERHTKED